MPEWASTTGSTHQDHVGTHRKRARRTALISVYKRLLRIVHLKRLPSSKRSETQVVVMGGETQSSVAESREASSQRYQYSPLGSLGTIRLVKLLPGEKRSRIQVELKPYRLHDAAGHYDALSYTWGSPEIGEDILVTTSGGTLFVTKNLAEVLRTLRSETEERMLWVDAISIDQENGDEKGSQLQMMALIYSQAREVIAWVGTETHDSSLAFESFHLISSHVAADWEQNELLPLSQNCDWADREESIPLDGPHLCAIVEFLERPYFSRLWIWQELHFGDRKAKVMCGNRMIAWRMLADSVFALFHKRLPLLSTQETERINSFITSPKMEYIRGLCDGEQLDMSQALQRSRLAQCKEDRDRVFAVLSLVGNDGYNIRPQYGPTSTEQVYINAALEVMQHEQSLDLLLHVRNPNRLPGLPSWVPDWTAPGPHRILNHGAAGPCMGYPLFKAEGGLLVSGRIVAKVKRTRPFHMAATMGWDVQDVEQALRDMIFPDVAGKILQGDEALLHTLCRNLSANVLGDTWLDSQGEMSPQWACLDECAAVLLHILRPCQQVREHLEEDELKLRVLNTVLHFCIGQALFETESGQFGLAPASAEADDVVAVLAGCSAAVVLQPHDEEKFSLRGAAYFDGMMDGEAFRGPLPEGVRSVMVFEAGGWLRKYTYLGGKSTFDDPRLDHMPIDNRRDSAYSTDDIGDARYDGIGKTIPLRAIVLV